MLANLMLANLMSGHHFSNFDLLKRPDRGLCLVTEFPAQARQAAAGSACKKIVDRSHRGHCMGMYFL
jgi:hypothetical protein